MESATAVVGLRIMRTCAQKLISEKICDAPWAQGIGGEGRTGGGKSNVSAHRPGSLSAQGLKGHTRRMGRTWRGFMAAESNDPGWRSPIEGGRWFHACSEATHDDRIRSSSSECVWFLKM